jgi:hypothetical protein
MGLSEPIQTPTKRPAHTHVCSKISRPQNLPAAEIPGTGEFPGAVALLVARLRIRFKARGLRGEPLRPEGSRRAAGGVRQADSSASSASFVHSSANLNQAALPTSSVAASVRHCSAER